MARTDQFCWSSLVLGADLRPGFLVFFFIGTHRDFFGCWIDIPIFFDGESTGWIMKNITLSDLHGVFPLKIDCGWKTSCLFCTSKRMVEICWNPRNNGNHLSTGALISISAWNLSSRFHSFHGHDMSSPDMRLQPRKLLLRWRATSTALSDPATLLKENQLNTAQISKSVRSGKPSKMIIQILGCYFDRKTQDPGVFKRERLELVSKNHGPAAKRSWFRLLCSVCVFMKLKDLLNIPQEHVSIRFTDAHLESWIIRFLIILRAFTDDQSFEVIKSSLTHIYKLNT